MRAWRDHFGRCAFGGGDAKLPAMPLPLRLPRPATLVLLSACVLAGGLATAAPGCRQKTAGIRDADKPKVVKSTLDGVWTLTLNPEVVDAGGQSMNIPLSLSTKRADANGGALSGTVGKTDFSGGTYRTGTDLTPPKIEFSSDAVTIPDDQDGGRQVGGPLAWKATLLDEGTLTGTVTGGGDTRNWTAKKNSL